MSEGVLNMTLKKKWFKMIASGEKKEEYREIKPFWINRLTSVDKLTKDTVFRDVVKYFDCVRFFNGWCFSTDLPNMKVEVFGIRIGKPNPKWCDPQDIGKDVFIFDLGKIDNTYSHIKE